MNHPFLQFRGFKKNQNKFSRPKQITAKIKALFADNAHALGFYQIELIGILDMVGGLEYHYKNFAKIENRCRIKLEKEMDDGEQTSRPYKNAIHEVTAYLNRLGQFYYLMRSPWFGEYVKEDDLAKLCPILLALIPLRHRVACHRSCDKPGKDIEINEHLATQASVPIEKRWRKEKDDILNISYEIKILKEEKLNRCEILRKHHKSPVESVERFVEGVIWLEFIPSKHHNNIGTEIYDVIELFFNRYNQAKVLK